MNGRIYDPVIGRFLSPDPYIQAPDFTQSLNRYIYCLNNPLSLTDPSGYSWLSDNWRSLVASAVAIGVSVVTAGMGSGIGAVILSGAAGGFAGGFTSTALAGGDLSAAFKSGAIGSLFGAASAFGSWAVAGITGGDMIGATLGHGLVQGGLSGAQGGKFSHGFFSATFSKMSSPITSGLPTKAGQLVASAVVGGTASAASGGKFANGAVTGSFVMLFNEMMHPEGDDDFTRQRKNDDSNEGVWATAAAITAVILADDATGIGAVDDLAIPFIWGGAASVVAYRYMTKTTAQYALVASTNGFYPVYVWGHANPVGYEYLNAGDVWKYGITSQYLPGTNTQWRYSQAQLNRWNVTWIRQFEGTRYDALTHENLKLVMYFYVNRSLPPGNKIFR